jgi:chemotaxis protein MotB
MAASSEFEEADEGYFASVSDLMVGILFVFLLMLTVFALNFRDAEDDQKVRRAELEAAIERAEAAEQRATLAAEEAERQKAAALTAQRHAEEEREKADRERRKNVDLRNLLRQAVDRMRQDIEDRQSARLRLLASLDDRLKKAGVVVTIDPDSGVLRLPEQILFDKGQSTLGTGTGPAAAKQTEAKSVLVKLADALGGVLPCFTSADGKPDCPERDRATLEGVLVEGHSDRQGYRQQGRQLTAEESRDLNDRLSVERSLNVFKEIRQRNGLDDLLNAGGFPLLGVSAYGDRRPIAQGTSEDEYQKNRRIDLRFILSARTSKELQRLIDEIRPALEDTP